MASEEQNPLALRIVESDDHLTDFVKAQSSNRRLSAPALKIDCALKPGANNWRNLESPSAPHFARDGHEWLSCDLWEQEEIQGRAAEYETQVRKCTSNEEALTIHPQSTQRLTNYSRTKSSETPPPTVLPPKVSIDCE